MLPFPAGTCPVCAKTKTEVREARKAMRPAVISFAAILGGTVLAAASDVLAQEGKLPPTLTFTAYDTGTSGFNIAVAVGKAFKEQHNTDVRVLPAGNDVARLTPIKTGKAQVSAMGT